MGCQRSEVIVYFCDGAKSPNPFTKGGTRYEHFGRLFAVLTRRDWLRMTDTMNLVLMQNFSQ